MFKTARDASATEFTDPQTRFIPCDTLQDLLADDSPHCNLEAKLVKLTSRKYDIPKNETPVDRVRKALDLLSSFAHEQQILTKDDVEILANHVKDYLSTHRLKPRFYDTTEECLRGLRWYKTTYHESLGHVSKWIVDDTNIWVRIGCQLLSLCDCLEGEISLEDSEDEIRDFLSKGSVEHRKSELKATVDLFLSEVQPHVDCVTKLTNRVFETRVRGFMSEQGLKESKDYSSTKHLDLESEKPDVALMEGKGSSGNAGLSVEIATMIYSNCDLKTCIQLRQVSTYWYNHFQKLDSMLEGMVKKRFPCMLLEGERLCFGLCPAPEK